MHSEKLKVVFENDLAGLPDIAPVFGTRLWLEATRKALPFPLKILRVYKGESLVAYLPLQFIRRGGLEKSFVPILTYYGGPYFVSATRKHFNEEVKDRYEILAGILDYLGREADYSLLLPEDCDARVALEKKWRCTPRYTVVNHLKSAGSLEFNRDCSKNILKAERLGLTFGETSGAGAFMEAFARTFQRKGLAMSWQPQWVADMRRELTGSGILDHLAVRNDQGKEIAFASVALDHFRKTAILWYSCSLAEADKTGAMHFLMKNLILRYREGFETFDLCGADQRSLAEFKEKFGQQLVMRFALEKYRSPFSEALLKGYAWVRRGRGGEQ